ncbi:MAG: nucleotidyltransferase family protein [Actinomycetota bacterium]
MDDLPAKKILRIASHYGVTSARVFGSRARGDARPTSDLDLLVNVRPETSLYDLLQVQLELQELLGIAVEVLTEADLHPRLRDRILRESRPLVAA